MSAILAPKRDGRYPFQYRDAAHTDVRLTWERERKRLKALAEQERANVRPIKRAAQ